MKTFEVLITAYRTVIVNAEDKDEAEEIASEECTSSRWEIDAWNVEQELDTLAKVASAKRAGAIMIDNWTG